MATTTILLLLWSSSGPQDLSINVEYNLWVTSLKEKSVLYIVLFSLPANKNKGTMARVERSILDYALKTMCWMSKSHNLEETWVTDCQISFLVLDLSAQTLHWERNKVLTYFINCSIGSLCVVELGLWYLKNLELNQSFSNFNVHMNHPGIMLKCRFWFSLIMMDTLYLPACLGYGAQLFSLNVAVKVFCRSD